MVTAVSSPVFGDRYRQMRQPAWAGMGISFGDQGVSASEAIAGAGLDYHVAKVPHEVWHGEPGQPGSTLLATTYDLVRQPHPLEPTPEYYGTVTADYEVFDNTELAKMLDPLSQVWPVVSCGGTGAGKHVFMIFKTGRYDIAGEAMDGYLLLSEGKDGRKGTSLHQTDVRFACMNTFRLATKRAQMHVAIPHTGGARAAIEFWAETLPALQASQEATRLQLAQLAQEAADDAMIDAVLEAAYPLPPRKHKARIHGTPDHLALPEGRQAEVTTAHDTVEYYTRRQLGFRAAARELNDVFNQEHPGTAGTLWATVNAVVETEDFRRGVDNDAGSALFGDRANAKKRAFSKAFDLAGIS